ncbi:hypothetical protein LCGC14_2977730 [marine sediment metagenome]|uniref:Aminotransferase class I/classII large domain-containing protein n=1 Tax=marine sediment metagenome TaxID=412755 RepID=A0A0F8X8D1_9ZZZZ
MPNDNDKKIFDLEKESGGVYIVATQGGFQAYAKTNVEHVGNSHVLLLVRGIMEILQTNPLILYDAGQEALRKELMEQGIDLNALEDAAKQWPIKACIVTPTFSNPSGACMSDTSKQQLLELAKHHNMQLIEDDIMGELSFSHDRPKPLLAFDKNDQVIYCSSFSKTIAPGLRIGWLNTETCQYRNELACTGL